jgi:hypothetical protein
LTPNWRIEPNLAANVTLADRTVNISGIKLNVLQEVKPCVIDSVPRERGAGERARIGTGSADRGKHRAAARAGWLVSVNQSSP